MDPVIVRIAYADWAAELDIRDYLESCLSGDDDIDRIWHVYPNKRGPILSAEASILDQLQLLPTHAIRGSVNAFQDIYELLCPLLNVDGVHPEFLSTIQLADERVSGIMERYRKWESENPRLFQEMVGFTSRVSALRGYMLEWSDRFGSPFTNPNGLRAVVHEGIGELSTLLQEQGVVLEEATDSEKAFYKSLALNEEIPEKVELFYGCTSSDECGELFLDPKEWKRHENIHFQNELWRCDSCSKFISSSVTFKTHLKDEHRMLEATIAEKLASNHIGKNYQGSFWCSFCHKIETHHLRGRDAHNKRLDHMERHFEERKDDLKDVYPEKTWIVGGRDGCQIINPTSGRINNLLALAKKQDEELR